MALEEDNSSEESVQNAPVHHDELMEETRGIRQDFILVFGLFASILIFLSIDVQVFEKAPKFSYVVGLSLFLLGSLQMFVLSLYNIVKEKNGIKDYIENPVTWFTGLCFLGAIISFIVGKV